MGSTDKEETKHVFRKPIPSKILVIGASGNVGRHIVSQLLDLGAAVRAMTSDPDASSLPRGADIVRGDLSDLDTLEACMDGVEAVFLDWPYDRRAARFLAAETAPTIMDVISKHARRIVCLSSHAVCDDLEEQTVPTTASYAGLERLIKQSGVAWTFLRLCMPASITLNWAAQIRADGIVRGPYAASARSLIHERDIAAVAVRTLISDGHAEAKYLLTGSKSLTHAEQVHIIGEAIGRPLRYEEVSREAAREALLAFWTPSLADSVLDSMAARVIEPERVTSTVEEVTGRPPRTFREWADEHADDFR